MRFSPKGAPSPGPQALLQLLTLLGLLWLLGVGVRVHGQTLGIVDGYVERGGERVTTAGATSTTRVQRSFPSATVTVYLAGTSTLATIYADTASTPKSNPFTADSAGYYFFYATPASYDITISGGGLSAPYTLYARVPFTRESNYVTESSVSFSATPTYSLASGSYFRTTLTGNITSMTISGTPQTGQEITFEFTQDATGGRTVSWPGSFLNAPTVSPVASSVTVVRFHYNGTNWQWRDGTASQATQHVYTGTIPTASLPTPAVLGRVMKVSDGNRGLKMDTGSGGSWLDLSGGVYHPQLFGARCDGTTDDSAAFEAIEAAMPSSGGTIQLPAGTCAVNPGVIDFAKPVRIVGHAAGSYLRRRGLSELGGGDTDRGATVTLRGSGSVLEDVAILALRSNGTTGDVAIGDGLRVLTSHVQLTRTNVSFHRGHGIYLGRPDAYDNYNGFRFESCRTHENTGDGIRLDSYGPTPDANVGILDSCISFNNGSNGFYLGAALYNTFVNLSAEGNVGYGIRFGAGAGQNALVGGDFEGNGGFGSTKQVRFDNLSFTNYYYSPLTLSSQISFDSTATGQYFHLQDLNNFETLSVGQFANGYGRFSVNVGPGSGQKYGAFFSDNSGENNSTTLLLGFASVNPTLGGAGITSRYHFNSTAMDHTLVLQPRSTAVGLLDSLTLAPNGNVVLGYTGLATNATSAFVHIPSMAGTPTGTPATTYSGRNAVTIDRTNHKFYYHDGTTWRDLSGGAPALTSTQVGFGSGSNLLTGSAKMTFTEGSTGAMSYLKLTDASTVDAKLAVSPTGLSSYAGLYFGTAAPVGGNYALLGDDNETYVGVALGGTIGFRINNVTQWSLTSSGLVADAASSLVATAATRTAPLKTGTSAPGTCTVGDFFFDTDATAGQNTYACTATNTWTLQGDGGGGGSGITSLNSQTGSSQTFANDTNVTISSATNTHTLGWTGTLAVSRGGTGAATLTGLIKGNGTSAFTAAVAGTDYESPLTFTTNTGLTRSSNTVTWTPETRTANVTLFDSANATRTLTFGLSGSTDPVITAGDNSLDVTTGVLKYGGNTVATSANKLDFFAATTSSELASKISDETGTGALVFANSPSFTTPTLGAATATSVTVGNTGLLLRDTNASHTANFKWNEDDTSNRTLNFLVNSADRSINLSGDIVTGGNLTTTGGNLTFTLSGASNVNVPTTGTLATLGGTETFSGDKTFTGLFNAGGASRTAPAKVGTSAPGTCTVGDLFYDSDATAGQNLYGCTSTNVWTLLGDGGGGGSSHALLSATHTDTTAATVQRGDLITGQGASPTWSRLAKGTNQQYLKSDGTDLSWASPAGGGDVLGSSRQVVSGNGLTGGGTLSTDLTLNVGAGNGISVAADSVAVNQGYGFSWTVAGGHLYYPGGTSSTTQDTAISLVMGVPGTNGQYDSHFLYRLAYGYDGTAHTAEWRDFVDVTSNAGASTWRVQSNLDGGGWTSRLSVSDAGLVAASALQVGNTGLAALDTDGSHTLTFVPGTNQTANRTLTFLNNDANRQISLSGDLTLAANFITSGANSLTLTTTGATNVTLPTTGTLATLGGTETLTNKTINAANNTLSNIPNSALTNSSITIQGSAVSLGGSALATNSTPQFARMGLGVSAVSNAGLYSVAAVGSLASTYGIISTTTQTPTGGSGTAYGIYIGDTVSTASEAVSSYVAFQTAGVVKSGGNALSSTVAALFGVSSAGTNNYGVLIDAPASPNQDLLAVRNSSTARQAGVASTFRLFSNAGLDLGVASSATGTLKLAVSGDANVTTIQAGDAPVSDVTYKWPADDPAAGEFLKVTSFSGGVAALEWGTGGAGSGDVSSNTATSVDSEIALFSGTGGKTIKRATTTGILKGTSGVLSAATAGTDYTSPSSTETFTNKTLDAEGTGNTVTITNKHWYMAAACNNATAGTMMDLPTSVAPTPTCVTGTNTQKGVLQWPDSDGDYSAQVTHKLPSDWTGNLDVHIKWTTSATSGNIVWQVQTSCVADAETDDPSWNTASTVTDAAKGVANQTNDATITGVTITGCASDELLHMRVLRNRTHASDTLAAAANLIGVEVTTRSAK